MPDEFAPGDVVQMKSGGPKMTVHSLKQAVNGNTICMCQWFDEEGKRRAGDFTAHLLAKYGGPVIA